MLAIQFGISDDLAYAPGILAMFNWAGKCPWKRLSIEPGGHGYFPKPSRPQMEEELGEYLKTHPEFEIDKCIPHKLLITVAPDGYLKRTR